MQKPSGRIKHGRIGSRPEAEEGMRVRGEGK